MPELAEVHTLAGQLDTIAAGRAITRLDVDRPQWLTVGAAATLTGATVRSVRRWGKRLLLSFCDGQQLIVGLGMTGGVLDVTPADPPSAHRVAALVFADDGRLDFVDVRRFGRAQLFATPDAAHAALDGRIGPDAAGPWRWHQLRTLLAGRSRRTVKAALLDQGGNGAGISGLGNYLVDEICAHARIHQGRRIGTLTRRDWIRINRARMTVIVRALQSQGLSFSDYRHADGGRGSMTERLHVYGRAGQPCRRCATPIIRIVVAGRSTFLCPACQPAPAVQDAGTTRTATSVAPSVSNSAASPSA